MKNRIQKQVSFMNKNQEYGLISANCNFINSNGSLIKTKIPSDFNSIMKKIYWSYPFNNPLLFFRRNNWHKLEIIQQNINLLMITF